MAKVTHARQSQSLKKESKSFLPRSDEKYTRIEQYDDVNFLNSLMFEFHLRIDEFKRLYDAYDHKFSDAVSNTEDLSKLLSIYIESCEIEEEKQSFAKFGYDSLEVLEFLCSRYNTKKAKYDKWQNIDMLVNNLSIETDKRLLECGVDPTVAILLDQIKLEEKQLPTSVEFHYYHPRYSAARYSLFEMCVDFNALESKAVAKKRINELLDGFYDRFEKVNTVYAYNEQMGKTQLVKEVHAIEELRKLIGSRRSNQSSTLVDYFYIYDQKKLKTTDEEVLASLSLHNYPNPDYVENGEESATTSNYSLTTLKKNNKTMKKLIDEQQFKHFFQNTTYVCETIDIED
jgi:hypothetical protein